MESHDYTEMEPRSYVLLIPSGSWLILGARYEAENLGILLRVKGVTRVLEIMELGKQNLDFKVIKASWT